MVGGQLIQRKLLQEYINMKLACTPNDIFYSVLNHSLAAFWYFREKSWGWRVSSLIPMPD